MEQKTGDFSLDAKCLESLDIVRYALTWYTRNLPINAFQYIKSTLNFFALISHWQPSTTVLVVDK